MTGFLLVVLYFGLAGLAALILMQPNHFTVTRSAVIDAPPETVFRQLNTLRNWESWSPWAKLDPQAATSYDGPASGPGAGFSWSGDKNVGAGRLTLLDSTRDRLNFKLDMTRPFSASNDVTFTLTPVTAEGAPAPADNGWGWVSRIFGLGGGAKAAAQTRVEWSMSGKAGLLGKVMNLVMNRDAMCGKQFEEGLANLAAVVTR